MAPDAAFAPPEVPRTRIFCTSGSNFRQDALRVRDKTLFAGGIFGFNKALCACAGRERSRWSRGAPRVCGQERRAIAFGSALVGKRGANSGKSTIFGGWEGRGRQQSIDGLLSLFSHNAMNWDYAAS